MTALPAVEKGQRHQMRIGQAWIDVLTFREGLDAIGNLVRAGRGGAVYTPNVDHIVMLDRNPKFREVYQRAALSFADGVPVIWASHLLRPVLPEKVSGSDLMMPLMQLAGREGWRVYLLGGSTGAAKFAAERLRRECNTNIVGIDDGIVRIGDKSPEQRAIVERIKAANPDIVLVALGAPKQEYWIDENAEELSSTVLLGVGASVDFVAGTMRRSPKWMSNVGLEWLYRLGQEPKRLWRRYLIDDPVFVGIVMRTWRLPRSERERWI
ncbi:MAG TPA: WecB/TagA/CpsF family glycosyltransferase [Gemmatimonadaceae bacterium]|jgi:N-acetylglucosaminyldiphosphoundecaprenol N-acetyl-beta-D-mannosaminyltransferase